LNAQYARKARELNADYVFVLDKPLISKEFVAEINSLGLPLVWLDHHDIEDNSPNFPNVFVYNTTKNLGKEKSEEPVSYWVYKISKRKEELWLAMIGCIADHYLPEFANEFGERYKEFWGDIKEPFDAYYKTEIGRIAQGFNFGLKDSTTNIVHLQNFLVSCKGPEEVFLEITGNYYFRKRYREIRRKYDSLVERAKNAVYNELIFFSYSGDLSISADIANELSYYYPNKYVAVAYKKGNVCNISLRGKNVKKILEKILGNFENASGGGHEDAVGARIRTEDLEKFKKLLVEEVKGHKNVGKN